MTREPDYKKAYEILDRALREAVRVLQKAHVRTTLDIRLDTGELTAEDDEGEWSELYVKTAQEYGDHCK